MTPRGDVPPIAECSCCPLGPPNRAVVGEGPDDPAWIVIGEGPGGMELQQGRPFVGPSGKLLDKVLQQIGADRSKIWVTNTMLCAPDSGQPLDPARECCRPRLMAEIAKFPATVPILTLGAQAAQAFLGPKTSITAVAGALHTLEDGRRLIPTIHPAAVLRSSGGSAANNRANDLTIWQIIYDAAKVNALARGARIEFTHDVDIAVDDAALAWDLIDQPWGGMVAVDVETDGLDARRVKLTAIGLADSKSGISIHYRCCDARVWARFREICADDRIAKVFHNRQYDTAVLRRYGVTLAGPQHDTMLMHAACFPGAAHDLQRVATQFLAVRPWKTEFREGQGTDEDLCRYNALDALVTVRLVHALKACLKSTHTQEVYACDNALIPIAMSMTEAGIPIDRQVNASLRQQFQGVMARTKNEIEAKANDPAIREAFLDRLAFQAAKKKRKGDSSDFLTRHGDRLLELRDGKRGKSGKILKGHDPVVFSISNRDHVGAYLQAAGARWNKTTAGGKYSLDKDVLDSLAYMPEVRAILDWQEAAYLYSHFVRLATATTKGLIIEADGRAHPRWVLPKITGRWGSEPNFQNWPQARTGDRPRPNLRSQVVAPAGRSFIYCDYAQLEARVIAILSGDPFLVGVFLGAEDCPECAKLAPGKYCPKHDLHTLFACEVWPDFLHRAEVIRKQLRDLTKRAEYGAFYGGHIDTLFASIVKEFPDVTKPAVAKIVSIIASRMPNVARWYADLTREAVNNGEIRAALIPRMRCFPMGNVDPTVLRNFPVQSTAANIVNAGVLRLFPRLPRNTHILVQGHDSLLLECPAAAAPAVRDLTTESMTTTTTIAGVRMVFPCVAQIGQTWADF